MGTTTKGATVEAASHKVTYFLASPAFVV